MELVAALPAELVAFADPAARGAAPFLRPPGPDADSSAASTSFEACLALLAIPLPSGEPWPVAGKELPVATPDATAAAPDAQGLAADAFATEAADAAVLARLKQAPALAAEAHAPAGELALPTPDTATATGSSSATPLTAATTPTTSLQADAAALPAVTESLVPGSTDPLAPAAPADTAEPPSWLDALATHAEHAARSHDESSEPRRPASPYAAAAATPAPAAAQPAADGVLAARSGSPRADVTEIAQSSGVTLADAPSAARAEWLPSAQGAAPSAQAPGVDAAPVDTRTPDWQDAFAGRMQWLVDNDVGEARITLHPPELGAVDIEISLVDDKTFVQLTTSTAAARDELAQSLPRLRELLSVSGLELGGASVHDGRAGQQTPYGRGAAGAFERSLAPLASVDGFDGDALPALASGPRGRIDVFA
jgi:flagellar hook-length control protein FliK